MQQMKKSRLHIKSCQKKYHPDTSSETNSHERFIEVNEAFKTLSKPISRRDYDLRLKFGPKPGAENFEYKTNEDPRESQPSWREKPYWQRTKEEDKAFRKWYYNEFGMGSPHSPNIPDPFWFLTGKQAIILAITVGLCMQYARYKWLKTRTDLVDSQYTNRMEKMEKEKQDKLEWLQKETDNFKDMVNTELEKNTDTNLRNFIQEKNAGTVLRGKQSVGTVPIPSVSPA
uniref:Uncharacterized protein LOC111131769 isoform X2 n=1 Tax=Crassostrea virginica TaxID=6565 RepID=A0A8B8E3P3_CRAVI|nr:uncharacterized protein LOC111131769 isoform X2 [Crassostrea virginica]